MFGVYKDIAITGIETVFPHTRIQNVQCKTYEDALGSRKVKKQIKLTGIDSCYVAQTETTEDMCVSAAEKLISRLNWNKSEIRGIILVTQTPSFVMPSTAFAIQKRLGIGEDCIVFDMNLGCSGYTSGLTVAGGMLNNMEEGSKMLLLVGDTLTKCLEKEDYQNRLMFGDAGTATALEKVSDNKMIYMQKSLGENYDKIFMKDSSDYFHMDGMEVFRYTIDQVVGYVREFMERAALQEEDIDYYIFHQAQKYIVDNVVDFVGIEKDKVLISYDTHGNTGGASIPVTIAKHKELFSGKRTRVLLCGFGVGLSCGIAYTII